MYEIIYEPTENKCCGGFVSLVELFLFFSFILWRTVGTGFDCRPSALFQGMEDGCFALFSVSRFYITFPTIPKPTTHCGHQDLRPMHRGHMSIQVASHMETRRAHKACCTVPCSVGG